MLVALLLVAGCSGKPKPATDPCPPGATPDQGAVLYGRVVAEWGDPIDDVVVWTEAQQRYQTLTDANGCYRLAVPFAGQFGFLAEKDGFDSESQAVFLAEGDVTRTDWVLATHRETT